jgi:hypothetical protein
LPFAGRQSPHRCSAFGHRPANRGELGEKLALRREGCDLIKGCRISGAIPDADVPALVARLAGNEPSRWFAG